MSEDEYEYGQDKLTARKGLTNEIRIVECKWLESLCT